MAVVPLCHVWKRWQVAVDHIEHAVDDDRIADHLVWVLGGHDEKVGGLYSSL